MKNYTMKLVVKVKEKKFKAEQGEFTVADQNFEITLNMTTQCEEAVTIKKVKEWTEEQFIGCDLGDVKIKEVKEVKTIKEVLDYIKESNGKIFSVKFIKRTTGELRKLVCRTEVKKHLVPNPTKKGINFKENKLIPVFDMELKEYRSIPIENITEIKMAGKWFQVKYP